MANPSTPDERSRLRIVSAIAFSFLFINLAIAAVTLLTAIRAASLVIYIETLVLLGFSAMFAGGLALSRRGKSIAAAKLVIAGLQLFAIFGVMTNEGLAALNAAAQAVLVAFLALGILPRRNILQATALSFVTALGIVLADFYSPLPRNTPLAGMQNAAPIGIAVMVAVFLAYFLLRIRAFALEIKLTYAFILAALLPAAVIGILSGRVMSQALTDRSYLALANSAAQTANQLELFINSNLDEVRTESQNSILAEYLAAVNAGKPVEAALAAQAETLIRYYRRKDPVYITSYAILDRRGVVALDSPAESAGVHLQDRDYFTAVMQSGRSYVSPVEADAVTGDPSLYFSNPIRDAAGHSIGVLRIRYSAAILQKLLAQQNGLAGKTSYGLLLDENGILLADGNDPQHVLKTLTALPPERAGGLQSAGRLPAGTPEELSANLPNLAAALEAGQERLYFDLGADQGTQAAATAALHTQTWQVVFLQDGDIFLEPITRQNRSTILLALATAFLAGLGALGLSRLMTIPILRLTAAAEKITQGSLDAQASIESEDEVGSLARAFNTMTAQLRETIGSLETRVAERTQAAERRTAQLQAAADVGSAAARLRNLDELLTRVTHLISQRFGFYHAGIFLLDEKGEYAVLRAANSEGGQQMLARGHKLRVGQVGIVGYVTARGEARIALDVGRDAVFFDNPDLPRTRSEMALPLIIGGQTLGALDVQSTQAAAFSEEDIATLRVLADQVSIAIENANLFTSVQAALEATRRAYGEAGWAGWQRLLQERAAGIGYVSARGAAAPAAGPASPEALQAIQTGRAVLAGDGATLHLPVKVRQEVIGAIRLEKPAEGGGWLDEDIAAASGMAEQLGAALESARLYSDISRRAERERAVAEITAKIRSANDPQAMLQIAQAELQRVLQTSQARILPEAGKAAPRKKAAAPRRPKPRS